MEINVNKAMFTIRKINNAFSILVRYKGCSFYIYNEETIPRIKQKFMSIVRNREMLKPIIEKYFENVRVAS